MNSISFVIGLDFGTDSVRAVLVNALNGRLEASQVFAYPRWKDGLYCDPAINQYRQHPLDHIAGIESTIGGVMKASGINKEQVKGICIDTTGSSPIALDGAGIPLAMKDAFQDNPNAMVVLWKDHTAIDEADEINQLSRSWGGKDFTKYEGGIYSSEWFWAKIMHINRIDPAVQDAAYTWMEHCDLMSYMLVGSPELESFPRSRCAAGHKAMWHTDWGGLPSDEFLSQLDPTFPILKSRLYTETYASDHVAGRLSSAWAERLGLSTDVVVTVGTFDAHAGAVGAEIDTGTLVRVMGTSTCDILVASEDQVGNKAVKGICGQVDGSVVPGMIGLEAGQSAFGDLLAWFKEVLAWPLENIAIEEYNISDSDVQIIKDQIIHKLSLAAAAIPLSESMPVALDWINGRRTPDANQSLKSAIINLNLGTKAPEIFKALVEAICFGSKMIIDRFVDEGITIDAVVGIGGVAKKSPFIMQTLADVLNMPIKVIRSEQAPALGAAMYAATAAGIYNNVESAINAMGNGFEKTYQPNKEKHEAYQPYFEQYKKLGAFVEHQL